jgi:hypothetical protein
MSWDKRGYYYEARKVAGRVVRKYVGRGRVAELAAQLDSIQREKRRIEADERRMLKAELETGDEDLARLCRLTDQLAAAALQAAGFHRPKGVWRKKRRGAKDKAR